jgi:hypothetical protein
MFRTFVALHISVTRCNITRDISIKQENMREISILKQRILDFLEKTGVSKYECYKNTGITNGVLSQSNGMSEDNLLKFLSYYSNINHSWLLTGQGDMLVSDQPSIPAPQPADDSLLYNMYKEERAKSDAQAEQIGVLKQTIRQLEEKILGLQQDSRPNLISDTGKASDGSTQIRKSGVAGSEGARFAEQP